MENANLLSENDENLNRFCANSLLIVNKNIPCFINQFEQNVFEYDDNERSDDQIPETDGLLVSLSVDMPDTTSASQLAYYTDNKDEV